ncbi:hypothetical protein [Enterobacter bugandensis]|uniref:hypothetical protein n=1 Tax=Enterobacter bugandensis TaxID=881260 RepID=UPI002FCFFF9C
MNIKTLFFIMLTGLSFLSSRPAQAEYIVYPQEPWLCDPVNSCRANGDFIIKDAIVEELDAGWDKILSLPDNEYLSPMINAWVSFDKATYCWRYDLRNSPLLSVAEIRKETSNGTTMSFADYLRLKGVKGDFVGKTTGQCNNLKQLYANGNTFKGAVLLVELAWGNGNNLVYKKLEIDAEAFAPPPAFETCFIPVTNMIITGFAGEESQGIAWIKPACPPEMTDLRFVAGNSDYSSSKIPVTFEDGRTVDLELSIDGKPANQGIIQAPFSNIEIRGILPPTDAGIGYGTGWVKVEFP